MLSPALALVTLTASLALVSLGGGVYEALVIDAALVRAAQPG